MRLKNGGYTVGTKCFFLDEAATDTDLMPRVDARVYTCGKNKKQQQSAKRFLEEIGVREVGEREQVEAILKQVYSDDDRKLKEKEYVLHIRRFIKLLDEDSSASTLLGAYRLFVGSGGKWHKADEIILDEPYLSTGLSAYYNVVGLPKNLVTLSEFYQNLPIDLAKIARFAAALGAKKELSIKSVSCQGNPQWDYLRESTGAKIHVIYR